MAISKLILNGEVQMDVTSDTVMASSLLSGKTATKNDGTKITGNIASKTSDDLTASGATVTAPAGYYANAASKAVATTTHPNPSASITSSTGVVTASHTQSTGYVTGGTTTGTLNLTTQAGKTITPTESVQTAVASYRWTTGNVNVAAISSTYVGTGITTRSSANLTASGSVVTAPAGYYSTAATKAVAAGSAFPPATTITKAPTIEVNTSGVVTASYSGSSSITPTVTSGYVSKGTAGTISTTGTSTYQLTSKAAATYYPSTADQTVASQRWLVGNQTFKSVTTTNLTSANIKSGTIVRVGDSANASRITQVIGTYAPSISSLTVTPSTEEQTFNATEVDGYKPVIVNSITLNTLDIIPTEEEQVFYSDGIQHVIFKSGTSTNKTPSYSTITIDESGALSLTKEYIPYEAQGTITISKTSTGEVSYITLNGNVFHSSQGMASNIPFTYSGDRLVSEIYTIGSGALRLVVVTSTNYNYDITVTSDIVFKEKGCRTSYFNQYQSTSASSVSYTYDSSDFIIGDTYSISGSFKGADRDGYETYVANFDEHFIWDGNTHTFNIQNAGGTIGTITITTTTITCTFTATARTRHIGIDLSKYEYANGYNPVTVKGYNLISKTVTPTDKKQIIKANSDNVYIFESIDLTNSSSRSYKNMVLDGMTLSNNGLWKISGSITRYDGNIITIPEQLIKLGYADGTGTFIKYSQSGSSVDNIYFYYIDSIHSLDIEVINNTDGSIATTVVSLTIEDTRHSAIAENTHGDPDSTSIDSVNYSTLLIGEKCIFYLSSVFIDSFIYETFTWDGTDKTFSKTLNNNTITIELKPSTNQIIVTGYSGEGFIYFFGKQAEEYDGLSKVIVEPASGTGFTADQIALRTISGDISGNASVIGSYAFDRCTSLTAANFPSATSIGNYAFYQCSSLTTANFPSATSIGNSAFYKCSALTTISFPSVVTIGSSAFDRCTSLTTISFPQATSIGNYAFEYCLSLTTINFPRATRISSGAFYQCPALTTISFPSVTTISTSAFYHCESLTTISFPRATRIDANAFAYCYNLLSLYLLGSSVISLININAFNSTPISNYTTSTGGVYGSIFVPASLYNSYITATNWATYSARIVSV